MAQARNSKRGSLAALVCALVCAWALLAPTAAFGLTTNKATARPNEDGGSGVIGGLPTRLTWEGTVDANEKVSQVTIVLPDDGSFDGSTTKVTALQGLKRADVQLSGDPLAQGSALAVSFATPIEEGVLLRLEVENMTLPSRGGDVVVGGSYVNEKGTQALQDAAPIATIANTRLQKIVSTLDRNPLVQAWNSNSFLGMFFKPQLLVTAFATLVPGWLLCLLIVCIAYPIAIVLGLIFALMKISRHRLLRAIAVVYINILRGTPLFLQIYIMFFGLPMMNINIDNNVLGVIVIAINASAYLAEIFRAGIQSIPQGQYEAASSLGMNYFQTMFNIILPQTVRRVIPTVTSDFITSYKDTSLLSSVGVMELMMFAKNLTSVSGNMTPYVAAAIFYLIVTLPLIKVVSKVEKRLASGERGVRARLLQKKISERAAQGEEELEDMELSTHFEANDTARSADRGVMTSFVPSAAQEV